MSCTITKGLNRGACRAMGGIKDVYFIKADDANYFPALSNNEIVSVSESVTNGLNLYKFENLIGSGSAVESNSYDEGNGTQYFSQTVTINARSIDTDRLVMFRELCKATVAAIVHYNSGISRLFGMKFFLDATGGENTSGEAVGDANNINIVLSGKEVDQAPIVSASTSDSPLGAISADEYTIITG